MRFNSQIITTGAPLPEFGENIYKRETMLFRADFDFAYAHGGPVTQSFLEMLRIVGGWGNCVIDSRVHMLMPGMWPCIPGWHHDDVPRTRSDGQPDYEKMGYFSEHCMAIWGDCSRTEFAIGESDFTIPPLGSKIYKEWDPVVEEKCVRGELERLFIPERMPIFFDWQSWHRGSETTHRGFRFFIRATRNTYIKPKNEIRSNANVYMPVLTEGW